MLRNSNRSRLTVAPSPWMIETDGYWTDHCRRRAVGAHFCGAGRQTPDF